MTNHKRLTGVQPMKSKSFHGIEAASAVEAFCIAAANSELKEMKLLLADGVDIDGVSSDVLGGTALNTAAYGGQTRVVDFLIDFGADLNTLDSNELTPLMCACSNGKIKGSKIALMLIEAGADVKYVRKSDQMTALKFAVESCSPEVIQALIDRGASVDGPRGSNQTALMLAARANNVESLKVLIRNGADPTLRCKLRWADGRTAEGLAELERRRDALAYLQSLNKKKRSK
jgi:ankyrin repeat protein